MPHGADPFHPTPAVLRWVESCAGKRARVVSVHRLVGGVANATHEVTVEVSGVTRPLVLRRLGRTTSASPDVLAREAATLDHVAAHAPGLPVPKVLAHAPDVDGRQALLMTKLPGGVDLDPGDRDRWLEQQVDALAVIHEIPPVPARDERDDQRVDFSDRHPPDWSAHPELWQRALVAVADGWQARSRRRTFVHGDFQHFNFLWSRGDLSGVVDWSGRNLKHPDTDTGHCRLNLVILYGSTWAEDFRRRYEAATGRAVDPWWDLVETCRFLPTWAMFIPDQVAGRIPFDADAMHARVDAHLPVLLERLGM